jgi:hypothetical protein
MSLSCVFRLTARKAVTFASIPSSISFSFHPFANIGSTILKLHAIRFTIREKAHYVAIDHGDFLQIQNDVVTVRLEFKQSPQLGYRGCFDSATQDEYCESASPRALNPESHGASHIAGAARLCRTAPAFHPRTDHN